MKQSLWRVVRGLLLAVLGVVTAVALLEVGVRVLGLAPPAESPGWFWQGPDAETGWTHIPGASGRWFNPRHEYDVEVTINSQGLRDVEHDYTKPPDVFRILILGDSYVEGMRVPLEQTFGKRLEDRLNQAGLPIRFEVVLAGVSAWGTDQQLLWYRNEGIRYEPDLVLLGFFPGNDFMNNAEALEVANIGGVRKPFFHLENGELALKYHPFDPEAVPTAVGSSDVSREETVPTPTDLENAPLAGWRPWLQQNLAIYRFATPLIRDAVPGLARAMVRWGLIEPGQEEIDAALPSDYIPVTYGVYRRPPDQAWQDAFTLTNAILRQLDREVTAQSGARLAAVVLTAQEQVYTDLWNSLLERYAPMREFEWDLEQPNRIVHGILDGAAIPYVDLLPSFRAAAQQPGELLHFRHDGHWTPAGEQLAADTIYDFLVQNHLVPIGGSAVEPTATP